MHDADGHAEFRWVFRVVAEMHSPETHTFWL